MEFKIIVHTSVVPLFIRIYMAIFNFKALTMPNGTIYYISSLHLADEKLRNHELKHIEQMEREGVFKFLVKYNYYWITKGYHNNPYEIEAREAEKEV